MASYTEKYGDVFSFHKERARCLENTDAFWQETSRRMTEISIKYHADPFVTDMLVSVYGELERQAVGDRTSGE